MKKHFHKIIGVIGFFIFLFSLMVAFFSDNSYFYVFFLLGSWFILDYVNFRLTKKSIINLLFKKGNEYFIFLLLILNAFGAFLVDYLYGVKIVGMWEWTNYGVLEWIVMLFLMTLLFCFVVYETYRFFYYVLSKEFKGRVKKKSHKNFEHVLILIGGIMILIPLINYLFFDNFYSNYFLVFAFLGIWFICDGFTSYFHGQPIISKILNGNKKVIFSIILSTLFLMVSHEFLNYFAGEWRYVNAPFHNFAIQGIPVSILIGWIPLVVFCISVVNLIKTILHEK
jgi:hypothetical protein